MQSFISYFHVYRPSAPVHMDLIYSYYAMRWSIAVCFAEIKGLLNLGKCQDRNFTEQIASIALCFMHMV